MPPNLKQKIYQALESNNIDAVVSLAKEDRKVLSNLVRLAYDKETLVGWRAIKAVGSVARAIVETDYDFLWETVRKLLWTLSDESGGIGWSAPEILGEIVSADPEKFKDAIPLIVEVYDIEEKIFRPGVLYALDRIAEMRVDLVAPFKDIIIRALSDDNPLTRVYALKLGTTLKGILNENDWEDIKRAGRILLADASEVWIYENNGFINLQVREVAELI